MADGNQIQNSKPDPEVFLLAAKLLGLPPEECVVVEDAFAGIDAAKAGGMKALEMCIRDRYGATAKCAGQLYQLHLRSEKERPAFGGVSGLSLIHI